MTSIKNMAVLLGLVFLSSCSNSLGNETLGSHSPELIKKNIETAKTKRDVESIYGKPDFVFKDGSEDVLEYRHIKMSQRIITVVPIISLFTNDYTCTTKNAYIYLDKDGNVKKSDLTHASYGCNR